MASVTTPIKTKYDEDIKKVVMNGLETLGFSEMNEGIARDMVSRVFSENIRTIEPDSSTKRELLFEEYVSRIEDCQSVVQAINVLQNQKVIYTDKEKQNVLMVYERVLSWVINDNGPLASDNATSHRLLAGKITCAKLHEPITRYSGLNPYAVLRWYISNQRQKRKSGPKVSLEFEKEVWGSLVICQLLEKQPVIYTFYIIFVTF